MLTLEHIVPTLWLAGGQVVQESGLSAQDVTCTSVCNQTENSGRGDRPLAVFGPEGDQSNSRLYTPPETNGLKRTRLAVATAHGTLCYPLVSQDAKATGSKKFAGSFGVPEYARRLSGLRRAALAPSSDIARRIALITSHRHKWLNPLVLRPSMLRQPRYAALLDMRLRGGRNPDDPQRLDCGLALLVDDTLAQAVRNGPV